MNAHPTIDWDAAAPDERDRWLAHIDSCDACRQRWLAEDPSRLFLALRDDAVPQSVLEAVSAGVSAAIRDEAPGRRRTARRVRLVAAAAGIVLALAVAWWSGFGPASTDPTPVAFQGPDGVPDRAGVQLLTSPGAAQVVDLTVGDTQVVMIFDDQLEL